MGFLGSVLGGNANQFQATAPTNQFQATDPAAATTLEQANQQARGGNGPASGTIAQQSALSQQLQAASNGQGPNPALEQLRQTTQQNINAGAGQAASARGINPALAARMAVDTSAGLNQQAAGQGATMAAQQQIAARGQLGQNLAQTAGTQLGQQAAGTSALGTAGGLNMQAQGLNQQTGAQNAGLNMQAQGLNAGVANQNAGINAGLTGGLMNGAGSVLTMAGKAAGLPMASGGEVPATAPAEKQSALFDYLDRIHAAVQAHTPELVQSFARALTPSPMKSNAELGYVSALNDPNFRMGMVPFTPGGGPAGRTLAPMSAAEAAETYRMPTSRGAGVSAAPPMPEPTVAARPPSTPTPSAAPTPVRPMPPSTPGANAIRAAMRPAWEIEAAQRAGVQSPLVKPPPTPSMPATMEQINEPWGPKSPTFGSMDTFASELTPEQANAVGLLPSGLARGGKVPVQVSPQEVVVPPTVARNRQMTKGYVADGAGKVPGHAPVAGDSSQNDIIHAHLTPGSVVVPRSITQGPNAAKNAASFVASVLKRNGKAPAGMARGGAVQRAAQPMPVDMSQGGMVAHCGPSAGLTSGVRAPTARGLGRQEFSGRIKKASAPKAERPDEEED